MATERVQTNGAAQVMLKLETVCRDGTTHLAMAPPVFMHWLVGWRLCGSQIRELDVG